MFEKCIKCNRIGESCVPNLMLLPFESLLQWWDKRQKYLEWSNQDLADKSSVPVGTIKRIKAGEYNDCRYSTIKYILITLIGGITSEFACTDQLERNIRDVERLAEIEAENEALKRRIAEMETVHRNDMRQIRDEYREEVLFLREQLKAWQTAGDKKGS